MKRIIALLTAALMIIALTACGGNNKTPQDTDAAGQSEQAENIIVKMADGTENEAVFANGFYSFTTSDLVTIKELEYQQNKPEAGFAQLKLILDGNSVNTIALMVNKSVPHGDYSLAWENAEYTAYADILTEDGLFGVNNEWALPDNLSELEIRVFDDKTTDNPIEIGFINLE